MISFSCLPLSPVLYKPDQKFPEFFPPCLLTLVVVQSSIFRIILNVWQWELMGNSVGFIVP